MIDDKLTRAMNALHTIGSAYDARRFLADADAGKRTFTEPLRASIRAKALTDEQIDKLAMDTWEELALELGGEDVHTANARRLFASDTEPEAILQEPVPLIDRATDRTTEQWARALDETKAEKNRAVIQLSNAQDTIGGMRRTLTLKDEAIHTLAQGFEDLLLVATTDIDAEGFITAYHFKTGALHRLLGVSRQLDPGVDQRPSRVRPDAADKPWGIRGGRDNKWMTHEVPRSFATEVEAEETASDYDTKGGRWSFWAERFDREPA